MAGLRSEQVLGDDGACWVVGADVDDIRVVRHGLRNLRAEVLALGIDGDLRHEHTLFVERREHAVSHALGVGVGIEQDRDFASLLLGHPLDLDGRDLRVLRLHGDAQFLGVIGRGQLDGKHATSDIDRQIGEADGRVVRSNQSKWLLLDEVLGDGYTNRRCCLVVSGDQLDLHPKHAASLVDLGDGELRAPQHVLTVGRLATRQRAFKRERQRACAWRQTARSSNWDGNRCDGNDRTQGKKTTAHEDSPGLSFRSVASLTGGKLFSAQRTRCRRSDAQIRRYLN